MFVILLFGGCGGQGRTFHPYKWPSYFLHHSSLSLIYLGPHTFTEAPWALGHVPACAVGNAEIHSVQASLEKCEAELGTLHTTPTVGRW